MFMLLTAHPVKKSFYTGIVMVVCANLKNFYQLYTTLLPWQMHHSIAAYINFLSIFIYGSALHSHHITG